MSADSLGGLLVALGASRFHLYTPKTLLVFFVDLYTHVVSSHILLLTALVFTPK